MSIIKIEFRLGEGVCYGVMLEDFTEENYEERAEQFVNSVVCLEMVEEAMLSHLANNNSLPQAELDIFDEIFRQR